MVRSKEYFRQQIFFETNLQKETRFVNTCYPSTHFFYASKSKYFFPFHITVTFGDFQRVEERRRLVGVPLFVFLFLIWQTGTIVRRAGLSRERRCLVGGSVLFLWGVLSQLGLVLDRQLVPNSLERTTVRFPNKILRQIQNTKQNIDTNTKTNLARASNNVKRCISGIFTQWSSLRYRDLWNHMIPPMHGSL